jgi:hypothetical protein
MVTLHSVATALQKPRMKEKFYLAISVQCNGELKLIVANIFTVICSTTFHKVAKVNQ